MSEYIGSEFGVSRDAQGVGEEGAYPLLWCFMRVIRVSPSLGSWLGSLY